MRLKSLLDKNIIRFSCSSFVAFLVDYLVYSLVLIFLADRITFLSLTLANISARVVSSSLNFSINRKFVFHSHTNFKKAALQFFSLAALILFCNNLVLNFLTHILSINHYIAKILTEASFFVFNFCIQNFVIFKNK
ncbi:MAG: GtrA family protein [Clostridia bacterium]|nr:GtrA family protein [Clostridia bacterium]